MCHAASCLAFPCIPSFMCMICLPCSRTLYCYETHLWVKASYTNYLHQRLQGIRDWTLTCYTLVTKHCQHMVNIYLEQSACRTFVHVHGDKTGHCSVHSRITWASLYFSHRSLERDSAFHRIDLRYTCLIGGGWGVILVFRFIICLYM